MVPVGTATYRESTRESTLDLIFTILLLLESLISCDVAGDLDHESDNQLIPSQWTICTMNNQLRF